MLCLLKESLWAGSVRWWYLEQTIESEDGIANFQIPISTQKGGARFLLTLRRDLVTIWLPTQGTS